MSIVRAHHSLALSFLCLAASPASDPGGFESAKSLYYQAVDGDGSALKQAAKILDEVRANSPSNAAVLAYAGSIRLLQASNTLAIWRKGKLSQEGLSLLDQAVELAPQDLEVRFVRAASTYHLPEFFRRREQSQKDFEWLAPRVSAGIVARSLSPRLASAALFHHGLFRQALGDRDAARTAWEEAVRIGGDTRGAIDANKKLQELR